MKRRIVMIGCARGTLRIFWNYEEVDAPVSRRDFPSAALEGVQRRDHIPTGSNTSSIRVSKICAILNARGRLGSYLPRSSAFTV
jgi:hypothetical protein